MFKFYGNGRGLVGPLFFIGIVLIVLGVLVFVFREILAALAAGLLMLAGIGFCLAGATMAWRGVKLRKSSDNQDHAYRENVKIRGQQGDI